MEWNIKSRSEACSVTGHPFVDGEAFYTLLLDQNGEMIRQDLCEEAWEIRNDNIRPLSFWKSIFKPRPSAPSEPVTKGDAESELRSLLELNDPAKAKTCALLALLLERKRILRAREKTEINGSRVTFYEHSETQETFAVPDVEFSLSDLENLQHELSQTTKIFSKNEEVSTPAPEAAPTPQEAPSQS